MDMEMLFEEVKEIRRDLHRIPELSFDLPLTSGYIREKLLSYGYEPVKTAGTGWIAVLEGKSGDAVAFRADMDGLKVTEKTGRAFSSKHEGFMHACGHDGHMAMLLGFARCLKSLEQPEKTVVLVFQPAEEGPGGARVIMEERILQKLNVKRIYGFHLYPGLAKGKIGLCSGPFMARNGEFDITVQGESSHAGQPHLGNDALVAAAQMILAIQNILSRNLDPLSPAVIHAGMLHGGSARNIVAGSARIEGTIRAFSRETYEDIKSALKRTVDGIAIMNRAVMDLEIRDFYPEVKNDRILVEEIRSLLSEEEVEIMKPLMLAEDFSFYQEEIPGVFLFLGTGDEAAGQIHPLHHEKFDFEESVLLTGIEMYRRILESLS
ncbi:M20 family metallopeptidase [Proteiniclasticum sp. C24MP]|uniref:M20 metallopeptidase family protein n=1 Tax=Proteiniclasticum sp. C24MP TaxID=3374101 RepID=UPI003753EBD2